MTPFANRSMPSSRSSSRTADSPNSGTSILPTIKRHSRRQGSLSSSSLDHPGGDRFRPSAGRARLAEPNPWGAKSDVVHYSDGTTTGGSPPEADRPPGRWQPKDLGSASLALPALGSRLSPGEETLENSPYVDADGRPPDGFGPPGTFFM